MTPLLNISTDSIAIDDERTPGFPPKWFLPRGVTVLLGPNGAGKTLLADILADTELYLQRRIIPAASGGDPETVRADRDRLPEQGSDKMLLILDDIYAGLDSSEIASVNESIEKLAADGANIVLTMSDPRQIPSFATAVVTVDKMQIGYPEEIAGRDIDTVRRGYKYMFGYAIDLERIPASLFESVSSGVPVCESVTTALTVKSGDKLSLTGAPRVARSALMRELASVATVPFGYIGPSPEADTPRSGATVTDFVGESLTAAGFDRRERNALAEIWLGIFHMEHLADRTPATLSGGELRMMTLIGALIGCPPLLLLDEPMFALDYGRRRSLRALISYIATRPAATTTTLVVASADPYDTPECVNRTYNITTHETQTDIDQ